MKVSCVSTEQGVLRLSILVTFLLAAAGIGFGVALGSFSIAFDGIYALTDATMTVVALVVANLITSSTRTDASGSRLVEHFTMGFWHLEPMVLGLNGILLTGAATFALVNSVISIMAGGRLLAFDHAIVYAALTMVIAFVMAAYGRHANRRIGSNFVALDVRSWLMSAGLSSALLLAFGFGYAIQGTKLAWILPYIDPVTLAVVCAIIIPLPAGTIKRAFSDILLVTPLDMKRQVDEVAAAIVARYAFISYRSYVARVGRGRQIELYFIVPKGLSPRPLEEWDRIRDEVGEAIGGDTPDRWLTIAFTTDPEWAD